MLQPRKFPLPHEIEYTLDCAVECYGIDAGSRIVLVVFGDTARIEQLLEPGLPRYYQWRWGTYPALCRYAGELWEQLDGVRQIAAVVHGVNMLHQQIPSLAETYADWAITDTLEGGAIEDFSSICHPRWDHEPTPRRARRLYAPSFIRRYVQWREESRFMRDLCKRVNSRAETVRASRPAADSVKAALTVFDEDFEAMHVRSQEAGIAAWQSIYARRQNELPKRERKRKRKSIVRAANLASSVMGYDTVKQFLRGKPVLLSGKEIGLRVQRRLNLGHMGHGGLDVRVLADDGEQLASLCVYHKGTPVTDQLTAFSLALQAGEERELLQDANLISVTEAGVAHPLLAGRKAVRHEATPADPRRLRNKKYWDETRTAWIDEIGRFVFGRIWPKSGSFRDSLVIA